MAQLLIVWHSRTGGTLQMAEAAAEAARAETETVLKRAEDTTPFDMFAASGFLFAAPENLAGLSGEMKEFFDRCYYPMLGQVEGRPYAQMVCAGSDGENAARQIRRIAMGWRLKEAQPPIIVCTNTKTQEDILAPKTIPEASLTRCANLGQALGAGLTMGAF